MKPTCCLKRILYAFILITLYRFVKMEVISNSSWRNISAGGYSSEMSSIPGVVIDLNKIDSGSSLDQSRDSVADEYVGCIGFNMSGPKFGEVFYSSDVIKTACECSDAGSPLAMTVENIEKCPEITIQKGGDYLIRKKEKSIMIDRTCTSVVDFVVVTEASFVTSPAVILCRVAGFPSRQGSFQIELRFRDGQPFKQEDPRATERNIVFYTVLAFVVAFAILLAFFLGFFCHNKGRLQRRPATPVHRPGLRGMWRPNLYQPNPAAVSGVVAVPQVVVTVSQGVPQDIPPSYNEAMLRHQQSGELSPSYSNACALMAAASSQSRAGKPSAARQSNLRVRARLTETTYTATDSQTASEETH